MKSWLQLSNPRDASIAPIEVPALADTGSVFLCIPEHVYVQLELDVLQPREVTLGAIPMEDMDLVVDPRKRTVDVNPASPNIASGIVKLAA
ncbi:MAG TPA: hypothetical protein VMR74_06880 [Gammaproteobacteria bacterium]|nr:hypothetical protein [Gammaproteobacteria bacterium]